jgi:hypothetical protein
LILFFRHYVQFGVLFIYLFVIACFRSLSLGADDFEKLVKSQWVRYKQEKAIEMPYSDLLASHKSVNMLDPHGKMEMLVTWK